MKRIAALLVAAAWLGGCAPVRPWQRGTLAHRCMQPDARPQETRARNHMLGARESAQQPIAFLVDATHATPFVTPVGAAPQRRQVRR